MARIGIADCVGEARRIWNLDGNGRTRRNRIVRIQCKRNIGWRRADNVRDLAADVEHIAEGIGSARQCCRTRTVDDRRRRAVDLLRTGRIACVHLKFQINSTAYLGRNIGNIGGIERSCRSTADRLCGGSGTKVDLLAVVHGQDKLADLVRRIGVDGRRSAIGIAYEDVRHLIARCRRIEVLRVGRRCRRRRLHRLARGDLDLRRIVTRDIENAVVCHVALHIEPCARDREVALRVKSERAVARIELLITTLHNEEPIAARDGNIRILARLLHGAVRVDEVGARDIHAEADLLRVHAANRARRRGGTREVLRDHVRERDAARFKARRVDVRDVVADNIHAGLMAFEARDTREHGTHHNESLLCCV